MQLKCIAIDDEPLALNLVKEYAQRFPALRLLHTFDDAVTAAEYLRNNPVDLLFIDINMPDINGIDLLRSIQQKPMAIFTTAYKQFAYDVFELDALDYLLKPFSFERFSKAVGKAIEYYQYRNTVKKETDTIFVRSEYQLIKINLDEVEYIESLDDYIKIHLVNARPVMTLMTLKALLEKLPETKFQRIHRSYVVNLVHIKSVYQKNVVLTSAKELPVSNTYHSFLNNWMKK